MLGGFRPRVNRVNRCLFRVSWRGQRAPKCGFGGETGCVLAGAWTEGHVRGARRCPADGAVGLAACREEHSRPGQHRPVITALAPEASDRPKARPISADNTAHLGTSPRRRHDLTRSKGIQACANSSTRGPRSPSRASPAPPPSPAPALHPTRSSNRDRTTEPNHPTIHEGSHGCLEDTVHAPNCQVREVQGTELKKRHRKQQPRHVRTDQLAEPDDQVAVRDKAPDGGQETPMPSLGRWRRSRPWAAATAAVGRISRVHARPWRPRWRAAWRGSSDPLHPGRI